MVNSSYPITAQHQYQSPRDNSRRFVAYQCSVPVRDRQRERDRDTDREMEVQHHLYSNIRGAAVIIIIIIIIKSNRKEKLMLVRVPLSF